MGEEAGANIETLTFSWASPCRARASRPLPEGEGKRPKNETGHCHVGSYSQCASGYRERDVVCAAADLAQHDDLRSARLLLRAARRRGAIAGAERRRRVALRRESGRR